MVFVVAEAGSNWQPSGPYSLIDAALEAGADAVKFQVFKAETTYAFGAGPCSHLKKKGIGKDIRDVFRDLEMPYEMLPKLADYCEKRGIEFMASAFSESDFNAIDPFVQRHKIASPELHHPQLLALAREKPVLLSTGMSTEEEIAWAVEQLDDVTLLQCTVEYPTQPEMVNLRVLERLKEKFGKPMGLSDHTRDPVVAPVAAVAMGASVIEKHFTLDNALKGPDHSWAITADELARMVEAIRSCEKMLGSGEKGIAPSEEALRRFSLRRIHALCEIQKGEVFSLGKNIGILRSGGQNPGIHPRFLKKLDGKAATRDIYKGEGIVEEDWQ